ncbi:unnamed protein product, partial [Cyprideis torosa]
MRTKPYCMNKSDSLFFLPHTDDKVTPLHIATIRGHTSSVACLLEMGAPVEAEEKKWKARPLHLACDNGHTPCVELLLRAGADINARTRNGQTPLHYCSGAGHRAVVLLLLGRGAEVDRREERGWTPLLRACEKGHVSVARDLVAHGADVNAKNRGGETPLTLASDGGHVETVEFLVREAKADLEGRDNIGGLTALSRAAEKGHTHVMEILLAAGAEVDARDSHGFTPLQLACMEGSLERVRLLIDHGADWTLADDYEEEGDELPWGKEMKAMYLGNLSPFICGLNHFWRQGESTFFQMPLCDADLHDWMSENAPGNRKRKDVLHFLCDCSSGLRFLHDFMKKIHRDIKPANIFLRREADVDGITRLVAKIGDLGLATDRSNPKGEFYFERSQGG